VVRGARNVPAVASLALGTAGVLWGLTVGGGHGLGLAGNVAVCVVVGVLTIVFGAAGVFTAKLRGGAGMSMANAGLALGIFTVLVGVAWALLAYLIGHGFSQCNNCFF